jgi:enoyl-CoA hydratase
LSDRDAADKYLSGAVFGAEEAARIGLVTRATGEGELEVTVDATLAGLLAASPQGLRETKALLNAPLLATIESEGDALVALSARLFASEEAREGMTAFKERRTPRWAL